jgi:hypothetical protein
MLDCELAASETGAGAAKTWMLPLNIMAAKIIFGFIISLILVN